MVDDLENYDIVNMWWAWHEIRCELV
jgi:hypothetical protein